MTDQEIQAVPEQEITFRERKIWVRMPSGEQLLVWQRVLRQLQNLVDGETWTADLVLKGLERGRKIIDSILVNNEDKEWLDDEMLDGTITFQDASLIIHQAVQAFADAAEAEGNREERRAAKKDLAKKAVRKAAS